MKASPMQPSPRKRPSNRIASVSDLGRVEFEPCPAVNERTIDADCDEILRNVGANMLAVRVSYIMMQRTKADLMAFCQPEKLQDLEETLELLSQASAFFASLRELTQAAETRLLIASAAALPGNG